MKPRDLAFKRVGGWRRGRKLAGQEVRMGAWAVVEEMVGLTKER